MRSTLTFEIDQHGRYVVARVYDPGLTLGFISNDGRTITWEFFPVSHVMLMASDLREIANKQDELQNESDRKRRQ